DWSSDVCSSDLARVGFTEEQGYLLNPSYGELANSKLDMVVAGTEEAVLMVESEAQELTEDQMLGGVLFAHQEYQVAIQAIKEFVAEAGAQKWDWQPPAQNTELLAKMRAELGDAVGQAYTISEKQARYARLDEIKQA